MSEARAREEGLGRRRFLRQSALAAAALLVGATRTSGAQAAGSDDERPNLLLLLTDDQRWDQMGNMTPVIQTPNMDRLVRHGLRFENAFVTTSICAASRASVFTGLVERTHRYTFGRPPLAEDFVRMSYPVLLRTAGYRTGFVGKFGVKVPKGATDAMFDYFVSLFRNPYFKKQPDGSLRHLTDITADRAVEFLRSCRPGQPFCLSVSFNAPHAEDSDPRQYIWPRRFDGLYEHYQVPPPPLSYPGFFEAQPEFLRQSLNRVRWHWRFNTPEKYQQMVKGYWRMITGVDSAIGRILDAVRELGVHRNTVVLLLGDNGYFLGERGFAGKWLPYEPSLRVPLVIHDPRLPGARRGARPEQMALNIDVPATMLDLAGVRVPEEYQGRSLVPIMRGERRRWREDFWCEHLMEHPQIPKYEGVRTQKYKYARYFQQQPVYEELYDLEADPLEEHNLARDPASRCLLEQLQARCDELRDRYGGPYPWKR